MIGTMIIAVDGSAASGKGTLSKRLADHFNLAHLDTGSLFRALALQLLNAGTEIDIIDENQKVAIVTPDKDIIPDAETLNPAYIVFDNYEIILKWNRSLRFALAVCTLKDKFKNEL